MQNIRVQFTVPDVEDVVNLEVKVNGEKRHMKFRVETFSWNADTGSSEDLIDLLRNQIDNYDNEWELYQSEHLQEIKYPLPSASNSPR